MKRLRLLILLLLLIPVLFLVWLTATEHGLNWSYQQVESYLTTELSINKLEGRLIGPVTITGFKYQQDGTVISAQQIKADWLPTDLLAANINISQLHIQSLKIVLPKTDESEQTHAAETKQEIKLPEISLPWRLVLKGAEIDGLNVIQNDQVFRLNKVTLNATTLFSKINIKQLSINADTFAVDINGTLQPVRDYGHDLNLGWQFTLPSGEVLKGKGQLAGSIQQTRLQQTLSGPLQLTFDATLTDLLKSLNWKAKTNIRQFDISKLNANWPALGGAANLNAEGDLSMATLTGNMQGTYPELGKLNADFNVQRLANNSIRVNRLQLQTPENNTQLNADGLWIPGNDAAEKDGVNDSNIKLALNWKNLRWPGHDTPWFNSANGSGTIEGNINHYQLTLDTDSPWPQAAPSTWHATATGNLESMEIQSLRINALNGEANINRSWK